MKRILPLLTIVLLLLLVLFPSACAKSDGGFGIYLADSGEQVISLEHIKAYHSLDCSLELTAQGIGRRNSFQTYTAEPKLTQGLYQRDFIIKINGEELCRGQFYSLVSSATYNGVVILDSIIKLDSEHNTIKLNFGYPSGYPSSTSSSDEARITSELESFFSAKHLLVADEGFWIQ
jgi:hypothetical protein